MSRSHSIPHGWYVVKTGKTMQGDMMLAPCPSGRGRRWYRALCIGLPIENRANIMYIRRQLNPPFSLIGWLRNLYFHWFQ